MMTLAAHIPVQEAHDRPPIESLRPPSTKLATINLLRWCPVFGASDTVGGLFYSPDVTEQYIPIHERWPALSEDSDGDAMTRHCGK
jgi:hypothetical protein